MFFKKNTSTVTKATAAVTKPISLKKSQESLERRVVHLKKTKGVDLSKHRARVCVVLDRSGSMSHQFMYGAVQRTITRLLPLALKFDDNGELEVFLFNEKCEKMSAMDINNYENYVNTEILKRGKGPTGGTNYAPAIKKTIAEYNDGSEYPAFVIFITDGDNRDTRQTDEAIRKSANYNIFYQFVGLGNGSGFEYLRKLDDLTGRPVDNTGFIMVSDFDKLTDDELYDKLLEQYPGWLKAMNIM